MTGMLNEMVSFTRGCEGGGACVEVGKFEIVAIRDSKDSDGLTLKFHMAEWREFVRAVKAGEFDFI
ncbi:MAG: DUF397 domain-containing protein [Streptosporangiaceae bacterium]|jgi:hypothetical protein